MHTHMLPSGLHSKGRLHALDLHHQLVHHQRIAVEALRDGQLADILKDDLNGKPPVGDRRTVQRTHRCLLNNAAVVGQRGQHLQQEHGVVDELWVPLYVREVQALLHIIPILDRKVPQELDQRFDDNGATPLLLVEGVCAKLFQAEHDLAHQYATRHAVRCDVHHALDSVRIHLKEVFPVGLILAEVAHNAAELREQLVFHGIRHHRTARRIGTRVLGLQALLVRGCQHVIQQRQYALVHKDDAVVRLLGEIHHQCQGVVDEVIILCLDVLDCQFGNASPHQLRLDGVVAVTEVHERCASVGLQVEWASFHRV
mmetsp:Transcript_806/g.2011  ORF Transcript_806/g.2011 Transcript_806/m.2011 type:complete len:313 (-) Transcript_806:998-1936(-)